MNAPLSRRRFLQLLSGAVALAASPARLNSVVWANSANREPVWKSYLFSVPLYIPPHIRFDERGRLVSDRPARTVNASIPMPSLDAATRADRMLANGTTQPITRDLVREIFAHTDWDAIEEIVKK